MAAGNGGAVPWDEGVLRLPRHSDVHRGGVKERATNTVPNIVPSHQSPKTRMSRLQRGLSADFIGKLWRPRPELNRGTRICSP